MNTRDESLDKGEGLARVGQCWETARSFRVARACAPSRGGRWRLEERSRGGGSEAPHVSSRGLALCSGRIANFLGRQFCGLSYCALWDSAGARGAGREKEADATCLEPRVEWVVPLGARPASFASHPRSFPWAGGSCSYKTCPLCFHSLSLSSMSEEEGSCLCGERLGPD